MEYLIQVLFLLIFTAFATITDLKKREVPNYINYFLIIFGIGSNAIISIFNNSATAITNSIIGLVGFYILGSLLYHIGVWGGGDAKLLAGFGAITANFGKMAYWPVLLSVLFNIIVAGAIFGLSWSIYLIIKNRKKFEKQLRKTLKKFHYIVVLLGLTLPIVLIAFLIWDNNYLIVFWAFITVIFYLTVSLNSVEKVCMYRKIKIKELVEGDWLADKIKINGKTICKPKSRGLLKKEIDELKSLEKKNKLKTVKIKEGFPYVPSFLIALILIILKTDLLFVCFNSLV